MSADSTLRRTAYRKLAGFFVGLAVVIQLPAWSLAYWQGWLYWAIFCGCCLWITLFFLSRSPDLIARRLRAEPGAESQPAQKVIETLLGGLFLVFFVVAGLDHLFAWTHVPTILVALGDVGVILGFLIIFSVFNANRFAASSVTVDAGQTVISTGPYGVVRHPMYAGAGLMMLASPFALGSYVALIPAVALVAAVCWRLIEEERYLVVHLPGYAAYRERTRFRLVPYVW